LSLAHRLDELLRPPHRIWPHSATHAQRRWARRQGLVGALRARLQEGE